jgi:2-hydroxy-6-oxonona-2,4-dienedioate hydrolase
MNIDPLRTTNPATAPHTHGGSPGTVPSSTRAEGGVGTHWPLWRWITLTVLGVVAVGTVTTYLVYARDLQATYDRLAAGSQMVETRHGLMEYSVLGSGLPILVVHGAGGGYDQGILTAQAYGGEGFRWIAPSRFGYLRTPLPADTSTAAQAEAFADLLDALSIERVGILAISGGVPPSLQFAQHYPERTAALVLLSSAPYTPLTAAEQKPPVPVWVYQALFSSDFPFWFLQQIAPRSLDSLFDVSPALRAALTPEEAAMVSSMAAAFQPVTGRIAGLRNEGAAIDPQATYRLEAIRIPTLVVHAQDDHINPFSYGQYTAQHISGAQFLPLRTGGHLLLGHQAEIRAQANAFLHQYVTEAQP